MKQSFLILQFILPFQNRRNITHNAVQLQTVQSIWVCYANSSASSLEPLACSRNDINSYSYIYYMFHLLPL